MARIPKPWKRSDTGTWHVQINGKQVYLGKNKVKAWAKYNRLTAHQTGQPSNVTARQVLLAYFEWLQSNRAPETVKTRAKVLKSFGESIPASLKAENVKPFHVQKWIDGNSRIKSPTTVSDRITVISAVFSWARRMGYIAENPIADMPKPRRRVRQEFLPVDTWPQVLELATDQQFRVFLIVMLTTGARPQEMFKFEAEHFDSAGKRFILPIEDSKGNRTSRVVYLPDEALGIVQQLVERYPEGKLFRNTKGKPFDRNSIRCRFRRLKKELKMPELTATTLRHSYAHWRLTSGQDALTVAKLMWPALNSCTRRYGGLG